MKTKLSGVALVTSMVVGAAVPALADPVQFGSNYFQYVSNPGISWAPAETAAESMTYLGATGYLATPTSAAENNFLLSLAPTTYSDFSGAWLGGKVFGGVGPGGSQSETDGGSAYWEVGPLAGQLFSVGQDAVTGAYANWGGVEPNDSYTFSAVYMNVGGTGYNILNGQWADALHALANGGAVDTGDKMVGYFVEFSPVPNPVPLPAALPLFAAGLGVLGLLGWRRKRNSAN